MHIGRRYTITEVFFWKLRFRLSWCGGGERRLISAPAVGVGGGECFAPRVPVTIEGAAVAVPALVDTGAGLSVIHRSVVTGLGYSDEYLEQHGAQVHLAGVGGQTAGHLIKLTLLLGAHREIRIADVPCVVAGEIDDLLILGQLGVLGQLILSRTVLSEAPGWLTTPVDGSNDAAQEFDQRRGVALHRIVLLDGLAAGDAEALAKRGVVDER